VGKTVVGEAVGALLGMSVGTLDGGVRAADGARDGHNEENHAAPMAPELARRSS
jgi:hypothetical protein